MITLAPVTTVQALLLSPVLHQPVQVVRTPMKLPVPPTQNVHGIQHTIHATTTVAQAAALM